MADEIAALAAEIALKVLKRICSAIEEVWTQNTLFDPQWISRRNIKNSLEKHVYITKVNGSNRTWVCIYCYKCRTGSQKLTDHFQVLKCNLQFIIRYEQGIIVKT
jgi:hypothetical protein